MSSRSRKPKVIAVSAPSSMPPVASADQVRGDPVELHQQHPDDGGPLRDLVGDAEQLLDRQAVGGLVEERRQVVHAGHERGALRPGAVLEVLLDAGVQVADAAAGASVTVSPSSSRISRSTPCVDGCCGPMLTTMRSSSSSADARGDVVPVAAGDGEDRALGGLARRRRRTASVSYVGGRVIRVRPPLVRRRDLGALVLDRDAAERVVLALRVARPSRPASGSGSAPGGRRRRCRTCRRSRARASRRSGRPRRRDGTCGSSSGTGDLEPDPPAVGHRRAGGRPTCSSRPVSSG